jgi:diguanylate cyclase (GGDEF)-like protein
MPGGAAADLWPVGIRPPNEALRRAAIGVGVPALVAVAAMVAAGVATGGTRSAAWSVAWTAGALSALVGMLAAHASDGERRSRWTFWAAAAAAWTAGQLAWDVYSVTGSPPSPNLADAGWWGFAVLVIAGLLRPGAGSRTVRVVVFVEALPLIAAAIALTFSQLWTTADASSLPMAGRVSALAYPAFYVTAAVLTLQAILGGSLRRVRGPGPHLVLAGIALEAVAFIAWSKQLLDGTYVPGATGLDALWAIGLIAIGAGGVLAASRDEVEPAAEEPSRSGGLLPATTFLLLVAALLYGQVTGAPVGARITLSLGLLFSGATLIARGGLLERRLRTLLADERSARRELALREAELARSNERLSEDVRHDALTGMRNRWALAEDLPRLEALARQTGESFALALCDVDRFKAYNDRLGHLAGDQALQWLGATISDELRGGDAAYRYGGEEVLLLLRNVQPQDAVAVAERIRSAVSAAAMPHPEGLGGVITVSIGIAAGTHDAAALLASADAALYEAKSAGRNRVVGAIDASASSAPAPPRARVAEQPPLLRRLRGMLEMSRAAVAGEDVVELLETVATTLRSELRFQTVAVNLLDRARGELRVVVVLGEEGARARLMGTTSAWSDWQPLVAAGNQRCGAFWLPAGSHEWNPEIPLWTPSAQNEAGPERWHPDDMLLLPLRDAGGEILGLVSVDEPLSGLRPSDADLDVLMAVADHAAFAVEQTQRTLPDAPAAPGAAARITRAG